MRLLRVQITTRSARGTEAQSLLRQGYEGRERKCNVAFISFTRVLVTKINATVSGRNSLRGRSCQLSLLLPALSLAEGLP
jgi:hypothetical protein